MQPIGTLKPEAIQSAEARSPITRPVVAGFARRHAPYVTYVLYVLYVPYVLYAPYASYAPYAPYMMARDFRR